MSIAELRTHGKNTSEGCQNNEVAGIEYLHSRMTKLAVKKPRGYRVKRPWGDPTAKFKGKQREDGTTLLEAESQRTSATDQLQQRVVKHWSRLLRDAVETGIFPKYNPN